MYVPSQTQGVAYPQLPQATKKTLSDHITECASKVYSTVKKIEALIPPLLDLLISVAQSAAKLETFTHLASKEWNPPSLPCGPSLM